jgi:hypothetical protein
MQAGTGDGGELLSAPSSAVSVRTDGAPPAQLRVPRCNATTASTVTVEWDPPDEPNGVVEAYVLYVNGTRLWQQEVNRELHHTVTGLDAFTPYVPCLGFALVSVSSFL